MKLAARDVREGDVAELVAVQARTRFLKIEPYASWKPENFYPQEPRRRVLLWVERPWIPLKSPPSAYSRASIVPSE
jgi:hypothetical protein